ncbi:MAG: hypothetical protein GVY36_12505 [Verrucomicrobia bacterium]|nr:hypothetical protein [Verrucomicrobiota bacterium]
MSRGTLLRRIGIKYNLLYWRGSFFHGSDVAGSAVPPSRTAQRVDHRGRQSQPAYGWILYVAGLAVPPSRTGQRVGHCGRHSQTAYGRILYVAGLALPPSRTGQRVGHCGRHSQPAYGRILYVAGSPPATQF